MNSPLIAVVVIISVCCLWRAFERPDEGSKTFMCSNKNNFYACTDVSGRYDIRFDRGVSPAQEASTHHVSNNIRGVLYSSLQYAWCAATKLEAWKLKNRYYKIAIFPR